MKYSHNLVIIFLLFLTNCSQLPKIKLSQFSFKEIGYEVDNDSLKIKFSNPLNCPLRITSWYRPGAYNIEIGGARNSYHTKGLAVDFQPLGMDCDDARKELEPILEKLEIRMEKKPGSNWVHIDLGKVGYSRYFIP